MSTAKDFRSDDDAQLAAMGHKAELHRNFSMLSMLGLAFAILNSWTALSASLSLSLPSGGSVSVIWGLVTAGICNLSIACSLAEFLSAYPTAGGQYHWVAVSWEPWVPILSWITGWVNVSGWLALTATGGLLGSELILGIISLMHPTFESQRWHQFLLYIAYNLIAFLVNSVMNKGLPLVTKSAFIWSITGFVVISITVLACSSPNYNSAEFVFGEFINQTGWPDGLAWMLGLLQGGLGLTGFDGVAHMIEEIPNAAVVGPKIMIYCVCIGCFTGFIFLVVLLLVAGDIHQVIESAAGCLLQIFRNATGSNVGSICLLLFPLICILFAATTIMATSSRMIYAFARDGGLPASPFFSKVHPKLKVPLNALYLTNACVIIFGLVFLGSSSAFNAIISSSVVMLDLSYGIPILVNCVRGRKMLPERPFVLSNTVGWIVNMIALAYISLTTVLFLFPPGIPVTGSSMNYCVVAFGIILIISSFQWIVDGRKNFTGPRIDVVLTGEVAPQAGEAGDYSSPPKDNSVQIHETDTAQEKPARALKHLLKLNHANHAILWNELQFHNHVPHILGSAFLQGADADGLTRAYEAESKELVPWVDSPGEINTYDWRDFLARREYQRAYVDFFEDELTNHGYDWKAVVKKYLYSGRHPLFSSLIADLGHPLIHLAYAFELSSREVAMEALALTAVCYNDIHKYSDDARYSKIEPSSDSSISLFEILNKVRNDQRFDGLFSTPGSKNLEVLFRDREDDLLHYWNAWKIENPIEQFRESQHLAAALLTATRSQPTQKYDFFFVHTLTTSHAVRVLLPLIPGRFQLPLVRQWWLMTLAVYIAQLRPEIRQDAVCDIELNGRDWKWAAKQAVERETVSDDAHYVKAIRACREAAHTWGDSDSFYLKAAVKFAEEFDGWGGFF
ncbi:hypothetical protein FE257_000421 [Aspergillus nanangensis]|uniref:Amino acid permease n=1 Tax=Aspergillus nanangensis TaxID=2582783 RepID=A0AAD4CW60_ASPNN|nr:hypothetical protein FE257_000421 [Aspergillus nanangensis]